MTIQFDTIILVIEMDCIFCKIISGDIPCYKIYEDNGYLFFVLSYAKTNEFIVKNI